VSAAWRIETTRPARSKRHVGATLYVIEHGG
jgi:hypothetical protein